jgi:hypothetical protein
MIHDHTLPPYILDEDEAAARRLASQQKTCSSVALIVDFDHPHHDNVSSMQMQMPMPPQ